MSTPPEPRWQVRCQACGWRGTRTGAEEDVTQLPCPRGPHPGATGAVVADHQIGATT
jgi:hypothetical protein